MMHGLFALALVTALCFFAWTAFRNPRWHRQIGFFRALLPSWKFFTEIHPIPQLEYRLQNATGSWQVVPLQPPRSWATLFINPQGNHQLALHSLIERVVQEVLDEVDVEKIEDSVSYRLLREAVRFHLRQKDHQGPFQFRLADVLTSQVEEV